MVSNLPHVCAQLLLLLTLVLLFLHGACCGCPMACNSRGNCNANGQCECWTGFRGAACAEFTCPLGVPWFEAAPSLDVAHRPLTATECSSMGTCDRIKGVCKCNPGFKGVACEIMSCPENCNGHGRCFSLRQAAETDDDTDLHVTTTYDLWDADRIFGCVCDQGYTGYDCSVRTCVKGQDGRASYTTAMVDEAQTFACTAASGSFKFKFRGETTAAISYSAIPSASGESGSSAGTGVGESVESKLEALDAIDAVTVTVSGSSTGAVCDADGANFVVTFTHQHGDLPDLQIVQASGVSLSLSSSVSGTKSEEVCNNRGLCSETTGLCSCYGGFTSSDGSGRTAGSSSGTAGSKADCGYEVSAPTGCPGSTPCTGHGICSGSPDFICNCFDGYMTGDCSLRSCPYGLAWWDEPAAADTAHAPAECSNRGLCDRSNGKCNCMKGFEGEACQRLECVASGEDSLPCAGSGRCVSMREMATLRHVNGVASPATYGSIPGLMATWDADKIMGCQCDGKSYLEGGGLSNSTSCELRDCPRGDDPNTAHGQRDEVQSVFCSATGGTFTLTFRDQTTRAIPFDAPSLSQWTLLGTASISQHSSIVTSTSDDWSSLLASGDMVQLARHNTKDPRNYTVSSVSSSTITFSEPIGMSSDSKALVRRLRTSVKVYLEELTSIGTVNVSFSTGAAACSSSGTWISIGFRSNYGDLPLMSAGNSLTGGSDIIYVVETTKGSKENELCSMHGECNFETGLCRCFDGWRSSDGHGNKGTRGDCGARDIKAFGEFV